jgi:glutamate-5-semialdehyde dehydrogenase
MSADGRFDASIENEMRQLGAAARQAAALLARAEPASKTQALRRAAQAIRDQAKTMLDANR